ncbi:hypothetical protein CYMTET_13339 [Cymbomonas tetramitiformis]|uniref:RING-type E3 ubiquitin transferase n=1 Tax=Cymbomonas tetramitiformis TaxID=36881 RepID=A0AAE0GID1_9CHLO|nr:hypothetical protein CYMTET_13339 [Cymbomonas tetramitiformis]
MYFTPNFAQATSRAGFERDSSLADNSPGGARRQANERTQELGDSLAPPVSDLASPGERGATSRLRSSSELSHSPTEALRKRETRTPVLAALTPGRNRRARVEPFSLEDADFGNLTSLAVTNKSPTVPKLDLSDKENLDPDASLDRKSSGKSKKEVSGLSEGPLFTGQLDKLREELACAVCLDLSLRPSTAPCGHSFCKGCLVSSLNVSTRCPKCRTELGADFEPLINITLWNTIQLLFPEVAKRTEEEDRLKQTEPVPRLTWNANVPTSGPFRPVQPSASGATRRRALQRASVPRAGASGVTRPQQTHRLAAGQGRFNPPRVDRPTVFHREAPVRPTSSQRFGQLQSRRAPDAVAGTMQLITDLFPRQPSQGALRMSEPVPHSDRGLAEENGVQNWSNG